MITLYHKNDCLLCDEIEARFKELVVAYKKTDQLTDAQKNIDLPFIVDDQEIVSGKQEIYKYLENLKETISEWQKFQSDSCYIDSKGKTC